MSEGFRSGFIAIVGRPNVGKSTLLNRILGQKLSITSAKPQTTRHRLLGIKSTEQAQAVYVDTPGMHQGQRRAINRYMNRAAVDALADVDVILFVVEGLRWTDDDQLVLERVARARCPVVLVVNKVDRVTPRERLLPHLQVLAAKGKFAEIVPLSAQGGANVETLERLVEGLLPEGECYFDPDQLTDRSERFLAAELVREKLMRSLGEELPYAMTVEVEEFKEEEGRLLIGAIIWVERAAQKPIVIGKGGERLKQIGQQSREEMERLFGNRVFLRLWVKVREGWSDDERALLSLGYGDG